MKTSEVITHIEKLVPSPYQAGWDNCGVQIAGSDRQVSKIAVALDPLAPVVKKAIEWGAEFILTHHPLAIEPKLPNKRDWFNEVMKRVFCADATLFASHTSLDVQIDGVVSWFAKELKLEGINPIEITATTEDGKSLGFGCVGSLKKAIAFDEFVELVSTTSKCYPVAISGTQPKEVKKVAICPGSGTSLISEVVKHGADVFITGDVKYHVAQETPVALIDVGHFSLEEEMMLRFSKLLNKELGGECEVKFFEGHNPFSYNLK